MVNHSLKFPHEDLWRKMWMTKECFCIISCKCRKVYKREVGRLFIERLMVRKKTISEEKNQLISRTGHKVQSGMIRVENCLRQNSEKFWRAKNRSAEILIESRRLKSKCQIILGNSVSHCLQVSLSVRLILTVLLSDIALSRVYTRIRKLLLCKGVIRFVIVFFYLEWQLPVILSNKKKGIQYQ